MRHRKNIGAALLVLCLVLSACGGKQSGGEPADQSGSSVYTADILPLDLDLTELTATGTGENVLYLAGTEEDAAEVEVGDDGEFSSGFTVSTTTSDEDGYTFYSAMGHAVLYRVDAVTGEAVKLEGYASTDSEASVRAIVPCQDGSLWVLEQVGSDIGGLSLAGFSDGVGFTSAYPEDGMSSASGVWRHLSGDGSQELERVDVTDLAQKLGVEKITDTRMDAEGRLYAASGSAITVLDPGLAALFTCKCPEAVERLAALADGGVGAVTGDNEGRTVYPIDPEKKDLGAACVLTGNARDVYAGDEENAFIYRSGDSLYSWPKNASAPKKVLSWSGAGVDSSQVAAMTFMNGGKGAALLRDGSGWPVTYSLARLTPADEEALAGRTVLTLATLGMSSETRTKVLEFNRTSSQYRIEVRDYSEYNTAEDISAGLTKLNTEILAGNMPDLLEVSEDLPLRQYASRGMIEDLWPFIESDPDLGRGAVMDRVLEADEINGKLCRVFPRFTIETVAGDPAVVGAKQGWTLADLKAAWESLPEKCDVIGASETKNYILEALFADGLDRFVDWEAGTASFDSPGFQEILEFCNSFPNQVPDSGEYVDAYTRVAQGDQMLLRVYLNDLNSIQIYRSIFGGDAAFVGYPNGTGVSFQVDGGIAMSSACKSKDGAWSFMRQTLLPTADKYMMEFPINRADFDRRAQESMEITYLKDENGDPVTGPDGEPMMEGTSFVFIGSQLFQINPASQEDYDQVMALYEAADCVSGRDENIWSIVQECAGACFAGDQTVQDAARTIQNRVNLYINERK